MVPETRPAFRVLTVVRTLCKLHVTLLLHFIYFLGASLLTTKKHFALHLTSLLTTCAKFPPCSCYPLLACAYKSASTVRTDLLQGVEHQKKIALYDGTALMHGLHLGLDFQNRIAETVPDRGLNRDMRDNIEHEKELEVAVHIAEAVILKDNLRRNCSRILRDLQQSDSSRLEHSERCAQVNQHRKGEKEGWEGRQPKSDHRKGGRDGWEGRQPKSKRNHQRGKQTCYYSADRRGFCQQKKRHTFPRTRPKVASSWPTKTENNCLLSRDAVLRTDHD